MSEESAAAQGLLEQLTRERRYADEVTTILRTLMNALHDVDNRHQAALVDARTAYTTALHMRGGAEILTLAERRAAAMVEAAERDRRRLLVVAYEAYELSMHITEFGGIVDEHAVDALDRALMRTFDDDTTARSMAEIGGRITTALGGIVATQEARQA